MTRVTNYRTLKPGDIVYPSFSVRKARFPHTLEGMFIISAKGDPYQPHIVLWTVEDGLHICNVKNREIRPEGQVFCVGTDGSIGFFSGAAVLFVD